MDGTAAAGVLRTAAWMAAAGVVVARAVAEGRVGVVVGTAVFVASMVFVAAVVFVAVVVSVEAVAVAVLAVAGGCVVWARVDWCAGGGEVCGESAGTGGEVVGFVLGAEPAAGTEPVLLGPVLLEAPVPAVPVVLGLVGGAGVAGSWPRVRGPVCRVGVAPALEALSWFVRDAGDDPAEVLEAAAEVGAGAVGSAAAAPQPYSTAAPMPNTAANPPTRPT